MFNYDAYLVDLLNKQGHNHVYQLPWAGAISKDSKWENFGKKYNISFIGSYHPERFPRVDLLKGLKKMGLNIWGNKAWLKTELKDCYRGFLEPEPKNIEMIYKKSKIAIYLDSIYDVKCSGITLRPFEITSAGTMMLGQVFRDELFDFFEDGKDFISFEGKEDLIKKAEYFLNNDGMRIQIARSGFEKVKNKHTYNDRINKMFEIVIHEQAKNGKKN